jgi:hypothetical protein
LNATQTSDVPPSVVVDATATRRLTEERSAKKNPKPWEEGLGFQTGPARARSGGYRARYVYNSMVGDSVPVRCFFSIGTSAVGEAAALAYERALAFLVSSFLTAAKCSSDDSSMLTSSLRAALVAKISSSSFN